jgi:hypothetical protein
MRAAMTVARDDYRHHLGGQRWAARLYRIRRLQRQ